MLIAWLSAISVQAVAGFEPVTVVLGFGAPLTLLTLPLSGRREACGGEAENMWWPVHSRGLLEGKNKPFGDVARHQPKGAIMSY